MKTELLIIQAKKEIKFIMKCIDQKIMIRNRRKL